MLKILQSLVDEVDYSRTEIFWPVRTLSDLTKGSSDPESSFTSRFFESCKTVNFELKKTMIKKTILTIVALAAFAYSNVHAQSFTPIPPSVLGASGGSAVSGLFDISLSLIHI